MKKQFLCALLAGAALLTACGRNIPPESVPEPDSTPSAGSSMPASTPGSMADAASALPAGVPELWQRLSGIWEAEDRSSFVFFSPDHTFWEGILYSDALAVYQPEQLEDRPGEEECVLTLYTPGMDSETYSYDEMRIRLTIDYEDAETEREIELALDGQDDVTYHYLAKDFDELNAVSVEPGGTTDPLSQEQVDQVCQQLGVPADLAVEVTQSEPYYWEAGDAWLVGVTVMQGDQVVAGAAVDQTTAELMTDIWTYSPDNGMG